MRFAKGHKPDSKDYGYPQHHKLMAELPSLLTPDLTSYRSGFIWQGQVGMCVGEATARAVQLWCAANGFGSEVLISGLLAYTLGRAEEYAGFKPENLPPLQDNGSEPGLVLKATREVGYLMSKDYPDPDSPDFDPAIVNVRPTSAKLVDAFDGKGLDFYQVQMGTAFRDGIRAAMLRRYPCIFATFVDAGFEDNRGEIITAINERDPNGGGHMLCVLDASHDDYVVHDNWWHYPEQGYVWGNQTPGPLLGTGRMSWACFEMHVQQVLAVKGFPIAQEAA